MSYFKMILFVCDEAHSGVLWFEVHTKQALKRAITGLL